MFVQLIVAICLLLYFVNRIEAEIFCNISENEYNVLNTLYIFTNGNNWIIKWIFPSDVSKPCSTSTQWYGLTCINLTQSVCAISEINLDYNQLSGVIPTQLGDLDKLTHLTLNNNLISDVIPTELGNLDELAYLGLYSNQLSGVIPTELGNLDELAYLGLYSNQLFGVIPTELGNLHKLNALYLNNNQLNGVIPTQLGNLDELQALYINNNMLTSVIPTQLGNLVKLFNIFLYNNSLSGVIPTQLGNFDKLINLYLYNNLLIGVIPTQLGNLGVLTGLYLNNNQLTGVIPTQLGNLHRVFNLYLNNNSLSGVIPTQLGNLGDLHNLDLSFNQLSGEIPSSFNQLLNIVVLFLTNNKLTGNLDNTFDSNKQTKLVNIDVCNNFLTGSIPSNIFSLSSLETFSISNNCMKGSLPIEICSSNNLILLILDGIHANCARHILPSLRFIKTFYATSDVFEGGIPNCLFNMNNLTTLRLSGNSITGTLGKDIVLNNKLTNLDLSTNLFSGEIPNAIQKHQWQYLNLGFNKIKDTIDNSFPNAIQSNSSSTLKLDNNRISGLIPSSLNSFDNISVLEGSIFSCSNIFPSKDPISTAYQCGTSYFYQLITIFSFTTIVIILIKLRLYKDDDNKTKNVWYKNINRLRIAGNDIKSHHNNDKTLVNNLSDDLSYEQDSNITLMLQFSEKLQQCLIYIAIFNICFWLLSSIILHQYHSTYDVMYGYNLSMTFLSGYPPAIVMILLVTTSIIFIYVLTKSIVSKSIVDVKKEIEKDNKNSNHFWVFLLVFILNLIVMVVVNGLFVSATINKNRNLALFAILVAIFKTVWKNYVLPYLLNLINNDNDVVNDDDLIDSTKRNCSRFNTIFSVGIMDIIIIPLLSTSFLSSNCFYFALIPQPPISSSYSIQVISLMENTKGVLLPKRVHLSRQASFKPPFEYSYQCGSTLMTTYDSVYIYMSILLVLEPLLVPFIKFWYRSVQKYERMEKIFNKLIPSTIKPIEFSFNNSIEGVEEETDVRTNMKCYKISKKKRRINLFFSQTQLIVDIGIFMTLSVTIGFILPIVGIIMCISLCLYIHSILSNIGGKLSNTTINEKEILEKECENIVENLINLSKNIYLIMSVFFSLFVYDTVGDKGGSDVALCFLILTILIPLILWVINRLYSQYYNKVNAKATEHQEELQLQNSRNSGVENPLNNNN
jgi:Leucine-rich repeat (LRR) protein